MNWTEWFQEHGPGLLLYARQWTPSRTEAEEALQDGFVRFWRSRAARDGTGGVPSDTDLPRLFVAIKHAAFDRGRRRRRRHEREAAAAEQLYDRNGWFEATAPGAERARRIGQALGELPAEQREVIVMKIWGGLTFRQIGEALRIPQNTAASRYRYALAALRRELQREDATR
ncbi:MAG: sigma-70 family RNA polymerase sigma factor [Kiritimatiellaeota bacterium]|nr:sigma-70 family RNA polymerase sigma factor [Kiritimatiellota bacterium]